MLPEVNMGSCCQKQTHRRSTALWSHRSSRWVLCQPQGLMPPRSWGSADSVCPSLLDPRSHPQSLFFYFISSLSSSVVPLCFKYVGKGVCFCDCFFLQETGKVLLPFLWTDSKVSFRQCVLLALLRGGKTQSALSSLWLGNVTTFTAQHKAWLVGCIPTPTGENGISAPAQKMLFSFIYYLYFTGISPGPYHAVLLSCFLLTQSNVYV